MTLSQSDINKNITEYVVSKNITSLGDSCFSGCSKLTSIVLHDSLINIGNNCFSWCTNLKTISIPDSVKNLGSCCFDNCSSLTEIKIGSSVEAIHDYTFSNCTSLRSITIPSNVKTIGRDVFMDCYDLKTVYILNENINNGKLLTMFHRNCTWSFVDNIPTVYVPNENNIKDYKGGNNPHILKSLEDDPKYINNRINGLENDIQSELSNSEFKYDNLNGSILVLKQAIEDINTIIINLETTNTNLNDSITKLENDNKELYKSVRNLESAFILIFIVITAMIFITLN